MQEASEYGNSSGRVDGRTNRGFRVLGVLLRVAAVATEQEIERSRIRVDSGSLADHTAAGADFVVVIAFVAVAVSEAETTGKVHGSAGMGRGWAELKAWSVG